MSGDPITGQVKAQVSKTKRWDDMYRKLHMLYLNRFYVFKTDYERTINDLNVRITQLETALSTAIAQNSAAIMAALAGHTHIVPQTPAGANPSGPGIPTGAFGAAVPAPTTIKPVVHVEQEAHNSFLISLGPAQAPLAVGSVEDSAASAQAVADIGV